MRIVQVNSVLNTGSTGRIVEGIGLQIMAAGHQSYAAWGRRFQPSKSTQIQIGGKTDIAFHGAKSLLLDKHGLGSGKATRRFVRQLSEIKPDLVHLHNVHGYYINYVVLFDYLKANQIPVVWTLHDNWSFTGHCSNFDRINCEKWKTECGSCPMIRFYPRAMIDNSTSNFRTKKHAFLGLRNVTIVTPCQWLANLVRQSFLSEYKVQVIHNGIDLDEFRPALNATDAAKETIMLGVASVWPQIKGLVDFCKLRHELPSDVRIVLIGLSEKQIRALPPGVEGIRRTESIRELAQWYSRATALVSPTYSDTFPTTHLEALACGTPVITYQTGGGPEALSPETGRVVERGNFKQIAAAFMDYARSPSDARRQHCRARAEHLFSSTDRFADYVGLYEQMVNGRPFN